MAFGTVPECPMHYTHPALILWCPLGGLDTGMEEKPKTGEVYGKRNYATDA